MKAKQPTPPGIQNGVIVDADYWLWIDKMRQAERKRIHHLAGLTSDGRG